MHKLVNNYGIVYFELNNWLYGQDYPVGEPFQTWVTNHQFSDDEWCKENKLCVCAGNIDMSSHWTISAPIEFVEKNCPKILTDDEYDYVILTYKSGENTKEVKHKKFSDFRRFPDEYGNVTGKYSWPFLEYCEENFGSHYYEAD